MRRDQLEHAIRAACQITGQLEVIIVGSQANLGTYPEYELPMLAVLVMFRREKLSGAMEFESTLLTDVANSPTGSPRLTGR